MRVLCPGREGEEGGLLWGRGRWWLGVDCGVLAWDNVRMSREGCMWEGGGGGGGGREGWRDTVFGAMVWFCAGFYGRFVPREGGRGGCFGEVVGLRIGIANRLGRYAWSHRQTYIEYIRIIFTVMSVRVNSRRLCCLQPYHQVPVWNPVLVLDRGTKTIPAVCHWKPKITCRRFVGCALLLCCLATLPNVSDIETFSHELWSIIKRTRQDLRAIEFYDTPQLGNKTCTWCSLFIIYIQRHLSFWFTVVKTRRLQLVIGRTIVWIKPGYGPRPYPPPSLMLALP